MLKSQVLFCLCELGSNPSIERTCHGRLRLPRHVTHVER